MLIDSPTAVVEEPVVEDDGDADNADDTGTHTLTTLTAIREEFADKRTRHPAMDVDSKKSSRARIDKKRIGKRKAKKSKIVFPKYTDRAGKKKASK